MVKQNSSSRGAKPAHASLASSVLSELGPLQNTALLQALHILTPDARLNQDSRRKLKQIYHLYQFIQPLLLECLEKKQPQGLTLVDHGAGKSYLGFLIYDLFFAPRVRAGEFVGRVFGVEWQQVLVEKSQQLAQEFGFADMVFLHTSVADSQDLTLIPDKVDVVTALHACDTATDDAIAFGLKRSAQHMVLVPCCQAEVAAHLRAGKAGLLHNPLSELWRRPLHTREFGSQLSNVLRCLQLESHGYTVRVTELVGWEHSMKNELIIASYTGKRQKSPALRLQEILAQTGLEHLKTRFFTEL